MLGTPADAWYVWLGLSVASLTVLGTAAGLPTAAPPDPAAAAETVDSVASSPHAGTAVYPLDAASIRLDPEGLALRTDGGTARAALAYGPVTPVPRDDGGLREVLTGDPPSRAFASPAALADRAAGARRAEPAWRPAPDRLLVRHVSWGDVDVTLVG